VTAKPFVFKPAPLEDLWPDLTTHQSRHCCATLTYNCICGQHRVSIPICSGLHGANETSGIKRWLARNADGAWNCMSLEPSVNFENNYCGWHGFITNGHVA